MTTYGVGDRLVFKRPWRRVYTVRRIQGATLYLAGVGSMVDMPMSTLRSMIQAGDVEVKGADR